MEPGTIKIFAEQPFPRLNYISQIILGDILGLRCEIVTDKRKLGRTPVINYSTEQIKGAFTVRPSSLITETGIREQTPEVSNYGTLPLIFPSGDGSDFPFDIFAASFYLVSRYEEYLEFNPDRHGRFPASESLAFRKGFLNLPVVDLWTHEFSKKLVVKFPVLVFRKNVFSSLITVDVDQPFEFRGKDVLRSIGGMIRDIGKKTGRAADRYRIVTHGERDPWDVFDYIMDIIGTSPCRFFIPVGDRTEFDRNPSWTNEDFRELVKRISERFVCGLHPSYGSSFIGGLLEREKERFQKLTGAVATFSRNHFIRIRQPDTYRILHQAGIIEDHSMGYPDEPGFRAGIARPYRFYDLVADKELPVTIYPFQVMDGTLIQYKNMGPEESLKLIKGIMDSTRRVGGVFQSIWHNTTLIGNDELTGWREVFETTVKLQNQ